MPEVGGQSVIFYCIDQSDEGLEKVYSRDFTLTRPCSPEKHDWQAFDVLIPDIAELVPVDPLGLSRHGAGPDPLALCQA